MKRNITLIGFVLASFFAQSAWSYTVTISCSPSMPVCAGTNLTFTAVVSGCSSYTAQWGVNGNSVGTGLSYSSITLLNNDTVFCLVSSTSCGGSPVTSNTIIVSIPQPPAVTGIIGPDTVCQGTLTSTYVASFSFPCSGQMEWVNSNPIATTNGWPLYTSTDTIIISWLPSFIGTINLKVSCIDSCGSSGPWSSWFPITVIVCTGIYELQNNSSINIFPNPATNYIIIQSSKFNVEKVEVYDVMGRLTLNPPDASGELSVTIDVSKLTPGIYFVKVIPEASGAKNNSVMRKFVVVR